MGQKSYGQRSKIVQSCIVREYESCGIQICLRIWCEHIGFCILNTLGGTKVDYKIRWFCCSSCPIWQVLSVLCIEMFTELWNDSETNRRYLNIIVVSHHHDWRRNTFFYDFRGISGFVRYVTSSSINSKTTLQLNVDETNIVCRHMTKMLKYEKHSISSVHKYIIHIDEPNITVKKNRNNLKKINSLSYSLCANAFIWTACSLFSPLSLSLSQIYLSLSIAFFESWDFLWRWNKNSSEAFVSWSRRSLRSHHIEHTAKSNAAL